jgi:hypothetical protein
MRVVVLVTCLSGLIIACSPLASAEPAPGNTLAAVQRAESAERPVVRLGTDAQFGPVENAPDLLPREAPTTPSPPPPRQFLHILGMVLGIMSLLATGVWLLGRVGGDHLSGALRTASSRARVVILMSAFLLIVVGAAAWGVRDIERRTRENTGGVLRVTVETTRETLRLWVERKRRPSPPLPAIRS